ncbi:hypothetical protein [Nostoc sp.]|uniref:hypothetical protein n=1 Tax=Nostoc sp. TaxID=1180 RepID=UPI002FF830E4
MGQIGLRSFTVVAFLSVFMGAGKNFNSVKGYSFLHDYGKADAAAIHSITGETFSKTRAGSPAAQGTFTWTRKLKTDYTTLEPTPDKSSLNAGLTSPSPSYMKSIFGAPGQLSNNCSSITNANFRKLIVTESVGSFRVTGFKSTVATVRQILNKVKLEKPDLYEQLGTEGMLCVRKVGVTVPIRENSTLRKIQVPETTIFRSN